MLSAMQLVLSVFPGVDLFGRGFEAEGFCVVRGPDKIWGGDIRVFHPLRGKFDGIIGGSPCQDFSHARRSPPTGEGLELLREFVRVVDEAQSIWFVLENVPTVPDIAVAGYSIQRLDLNARECGSKQKRLRHFQYGCRDSSILVPARVVVPARCVTRDGESRIALATEGRKPNRRGWSDFCELQGLPRAFTLPGMTLAARYRAVGNGVHVAVARTIARAILDAQARTDPVRVCVCGCGRITQGNQRAALPACRKRMQRRRDRAGRGNADAVTVTASRSP